MEKFRRQKIYDWVRKNKDNKGAEYGPFVANHADYDRIRIRLHSAYNYASYAAQPLGSDKKRMIIRIGEKIPFDQMNNAKEDFV